MYPALRTFTALRGTGPSPRETVRALVEEKDDTPEGSNRDAAIGDQQEDTYGMSVVSLVRDLHRMAVEDDTKLVRGTRLFTTMFALVLTIGAQVFLLVLSAKYISNKAVHDVRIAYDMFENKIYGEGNTRMTVNGYRRGNEWPGLEVAESRLNELSDDEKESVCKLSLSQPYFYGSLLFVWSLSCLIEMRRCATLFWGVIVLTGNVSTMKDALVDLDADGDDDSKGGEKLVEGLTIPVKLALTFLLFLPWLCITAFLLWVGCRWLLATTDFADLVLNALALGFILSLKELVYQALMPIRNRLDIQKTFIKPIYTWNTMSNDFSHVCMFFSSLWWLLATIAWVILYMLYFQAVLPEYQWDVHEVCKDYLLARFAV